MEVIRVIMETKKKTRKVALYRGEEAISSYSQHAAEAPLALLRAIRREFSRNPTLTHAVLRDTSGRCWEVNRHMSRLRVLWLSLIVR